MNRDLFSVLLLIQLLTFTTASFGAEFGSIRGTHPSTEAMEGEYIMVIEGFDWGPAVSKVILKMSNEHSLVEPSNFDVWTRRKARCVDLEEHEAQGARKVLKGYPSDEKGRLVTSGRFITLELEVGPDLILSNPFNYTTSNGCSGNDWVEYQLQIRDKTSGESWVREGARLLPLIDKFDLNGKFKYSKDLEMSYAFYSPESKKESKKESSPLIIWLHGGGEGGSDPTIPLLANRAANYASDEIQGFFGGAYVLVPQCPGAWMHNERGVATWGEEEDVYNPGLMALIRGFVASHPDIDTRRIYIGGCSNGGYMSLKLILMNPDYFAAGFISALAYKSEYISDNQIKSISRVPIWFIHSRDDNVTRPEETVVPIYTRLKDQEAREVRFSFFDHVVDVSGKFGGQEHHYPGHWSWIYSHANKCRLDYDGKPVTLNGSEVSLMEWMAAQIND